jgi:competence ComEA-like helix-hairpin-helix protein
MWGREMRAGLVFVVAALLIGGGFREWRRSHEERFQDLVQTLEERNSPNAAPFLTRSDATPSDSGSDRIGPGGNRPPSRVLRGIPVGRIDPNRASVLELTRLPGFGPSLAARIVADRDHHGRYPAPEALLRVRGIGPKTLERIRGYLSFPSAAGDDSLIEH